MEHAYKPTTQDQYDELLSQFLISSWSYSKLMSFARHEKAFEMTYIYNYKIRKSSTTVAGSAYHEALEAYFKAKMEGIQLDLADLQQKAYEYILEVPANDWKIQKTTPTVEACINKAIKIANQLITNFMKEKAVYEDDIAEIISVEVSYKNRWLVVNGVDIPLPANGKADLKYRSVRSTIVLTDHKSKASFTDEKEQKLAIGKQAIAYALLDEDATGDRIDEVKFIENKYSVNKNGASQLNPITVLLDDDTRYLYEYMLYEPLKRFLEAISDPDYVYLINDSDNFVDKAEIHEFWMKTMIAEVDDFDIPDSKKELIGKRLKKIRDAKLATVNPNVIKNFKEHASSFIKYDLSNKNMTTSEKIEHALYSFNIPAQVEHVLKGFSSDTYLLNVQAGTKLNTITSRKMDIANAIDVAKVRIMKDLFVYEGKSYLAIESGKERVEDLLYDASLLSGRKIPLGRNNFDDLVVWDLANHSTPHLLMCGSTGSGKSVCVRTILEYVKLMGMDEIIIFDPKYEFVEIYDGDPDIQIYCDIIDIEAKMRSLVKQMQEMTKSRQKKNIFVAFDELADAMDQSTKGAKLKVYESQVVGMTQKGVPKTQRVHTDTLLSLDENLKMLLQKGRSLGFRILGATQRASTKVITGDAKVNFPVRTCFKVGTEIDSRVVLDDSGAEDLVGYGDGLFKSPEYNNQLIRFQGFYKPEPEHSQTT